MDIGIHDLYYSRQLKILTCTSSGRPVDLIQWFRDGKVIEKSNTIYDMAQALVNESSAEYRHTLSSNNTSYFHGRFTCVISDVDKNSDRRTLMINSKYNCILLFC